MKRKKLRGRVFRDERGVCENPISFEIRRETVERNGFTVHSVFRKVNGRNACLIGFVRESDAERWIYGVYGKDNVRITRNF